MLRPTQKETMLGAAIFRQHLLRKSHQPDAPEMGAEEHTALHDEFDEAYATLSPEMQELVDGIDSSMHKQHAQPVTKSKRKLAKPTKATRAKAKAEAKSRKHR